VLAGVDEDWVEMGIFFHEPVDGRDFHEVGPGAYDVC
jgi:hypothetical protein